MSASDTVIWFYVLLHIFFIVTSSSIFGSQKDMEEQADAIIIYFGLNYE